MSTDDTFLALIDHYAQNGMFGHILQVCKPIQAGREDAQFWYAYALAANGNHSEAMRILRDLRQNPNVGLAVTASMISIHKLANNQDKEELTRLKEDLKNLSKSSNDNDLIFAARYFWHADKGKQAKQCLEKVLSKDKKNVPALALFGWLNLTGGGRGEKKAIPLFDQALKKSEHDLVSLMGRARANEIKKDFDGAMADLDKVIVEYKDFLPGLLVKSRVLMVMGNWDEAMNVTQRVISRKDPDSVGGLRMLVIFLLAREAKYPPAANRISDLTEALDQHEAKNPQLFFEISRLFSRLAAKEESILDLTINMVEKACKLDPMNSAYVAERAHQLMLKGEYTSACEVFNEASSMDESNVLAVHGRIKCKILMNSWTEAASELEFLAEVTKVDDNSEILFLQALLNAHNNKQQEAQDLLCKAVDQHVKMLEDVPAGFEYFVAYNPDFVLELATQFMLRLGTEPHSPSDPPDDMLNKVVKLLKDLTNLFPGLLMGQLLLAKACFISGQFDISERHLAACLKRDNAFAAAHVVQAQICLARDNFGQCAQELEQARALDFDVRNTPTFMLTKARYLSGSGKLTEAAEVLDMAMELPGVKRSSATNPLPAQERIAIYLEQAKVQSKLEHLVEATKIMSDAKSEFENSPYSINILMAECDLLVAQRQYNQALASLRNIPQTSPAWSRAKIKMAEIYLKHKKNVKLYAQCYQEMAHKSKSVHTQILLGEAYMEIQMPEKAIKAFEDALQMNPDDPNLASRIGKALVATHDYAKAVEYYETAAKGDPSKIYLFHDLAELYLQLKKYDEAVRVLQEALHGYPNKDEEDIVTCMNDVKSQMILADVHTESKANEELVRKALNAAWLLQQRVCANLRSTNPDEKRKQQQIAADLCFKVAESYAKTKDEEKAKSYYQEALKQDENHQNSRLALARLHLQKGELEECQSLCVQMSRSHNEEASMMLADLMFRKNENESATFYFQQLLEHNPTRYTALEKLIQLLRRAGRLVDAPRFIKLAERSSPKAGFAPGLRYCKGLIAWFSNNPRDAMNEFHHARQDGEWGKKAVQAMIDIYLNPDNVGLFAEATEAKGDNSENVVEATKLLKELSFTLKTSDPERYTCLEAYCLLASKSKVKMEQALQLFLNINKDDVDYVPAILGTANAFTLLGQHPKARNQLKRIYKMKVQLAYSNEFEKAWLMLANIYIGSGKFDLAQDLCRKCLGVNKSCAKAYEMLGLIMEKEQAYRDASENYENAWNFMNQSSSSIGYKLAFNYLKAKRYVEAIDVCHKVLKKDPNYPKIKKDILDKARQSLRP